MTPEGIIENLLERKCINAKEAMVLLKAIIKNENGCKCSHKPHNEKCGNESLNDYLEKNGLFQPYQPMPIIYDTPCQPNKEIRVGDNPNNQFEIGDKPGLGMIVTCSSNGNVINQN